MTELNIADNLIEKDGAADIADAIPTMGALTSLNMSNNNLSGGHWEGSDWVTDMSGIYGDVPLVASGN